MRARAPRPPLGAAARGLFAAIALFLGFAAAAGAAPPPFARAEGGGGREGGRAAAPLCRPSPAAPANRRGPVREPKALRSVLTPGARIAREWSGGPARPPVGLAGAPVRALWRCDARGIAGPQAVPWPGRSRPGATSDPPAPRPPPPAPGPR